MSSRPEDAFKQTTDRTERRRLRACVVADYRSRVTSIVRSVLPREHWDEGLQVGLLGLLVALEKFDPSAGRDFWYCASTAVRDEIRAWRDRALNWRKDTNRGRSPTRVAARERAQQVSQHSSADARSANGEGLSIKEAYFDSQAPTPEDSYATEEARQRCATFVSTLNDEDRAALFSPKNPRHRSLVQNARAFVLGSDDEWTSKHCTRPSEPATG